MAGSFFVETLGCPKNQVDSDKLTGTLLADGMVPAELGGSDEVTTRALSPWNVVDAEIIGGAGGRAHATGDYFYGDLRRPYTQAGMWGLMRVLGPTQADLKPLR